jgi:TonB family protein
VSIAILDFGSSVTAQRSAAVIGRALLEGSAAEQFKIVDHDLSAAAARGFGYSGSLNLSLPEARDLGSAIGCDLFFTGDAQTLRRLPSEGSAYFESYASIFLVSARTGKLILWERPAVQRAAAGEAEQALLELLASQDTGRRYILAINRALADESNARASALETPAPVIEEASEEDNSTANGLRLPRPYRRMKPPYPETAARSEVEATVDVMVDIDAQGEVGRIEIVRWAGFGLDQSVIDTVKQLHFFPAMRAGTPIPLRVLLRYNFRKPPVPNRSR